MAIFYYIILSASRNHVSALKGIKITNKFWNILIIGKIQAGSTGSAILGLRKSKRLGLRTLVKAKNRDETK